MRYRSIIIFCKESCRDGSILYTNCFETILFPKIRTSTFSSFNAGDFYTKQSYISDTFYVTGTEIVNGVMIYDIDL